MDINQATRDVHVGDLVLAQRQELGSIHLIGQSAKLNDVLLKSQVPTGAGGVLEPVQDVFPSSDRQDTAAGSRPGHDICRGFAPELDCSSAAIRPGVNAAMPVRTITSTNAWAIRRGVEGGKRLLVSQPAPRHSTQCEE